MWAIGLLCAAIAFVIAIVSRKLVEVPALKQKKWFEVVKSTGQR